MSVVTGSDQSIALQPGIGDADFFVSYAESDLAWAVWIAWHLEAAGYRTVLKAWDFGVGSHLVQEVHRATATAARTVAVLSSAYLVSAYQTAEWQAALIADPTGTQRRLVGVRVEDCPLDGLLRQLVGVDLFGLDQDEAHHRLLAAVTGGRAKPEVPPGFPGAADPHRRPPRFPSPLPAGAAAGWDAGRSPFPGLAAFDASRAAVFAGREQEIRHLADRLVEPAGDAAGLMVVFGPSGCGKSSLVAAGLASRLADDPDWLVLPPMTPGSRPTTALAAVLAAIGRRHGLGWQSQDLESRLATSVAVGEIVGELLAAASSARRLLLVVDQAEELLVGAGPSERADFLALLAVATRGPVRAVATLRSEYLDRLLEAAAPVGLPLRAEPLAPLAPGLLPVVITTPAHLAGLTIDDELVAQMVADTGDGQGLPLLAYTLQRLDEAAREAHTTVLSPGLYKQVGKVQGALVAHADAALNHATTETGHPADTVLATLLRLVTVDTDGRPIRQRISLDQLPDTTRGELLPFVDRRLLVTGATPGGPVTIEVAHERLLSSWPPLAQAIAADTDRLRQRAQTETAAGDWLQAKRPVGQLWGYSRADSTLRTLDPGSLSPTARLFLTTSRRHARRRLTTAFATLTVLLLAATSLGITAWLQSQTADEQRQTAENRRRTAVADQLLALADNDRDDDPANALRLAVAAHDIAPEDERTRARANLLQTLIDTPHLRSTLTGHTNWVNVVAFGPDGLLATGADDGTVRLWDVSTPAAARQVGAPLTGHTGPVLTMAFGPDGLLATGGDDSMVRLWDTSAPAAPRQVGNSLTGHTEAVNAVAFGPDGLLATGADDGTVRLWDVSTPAAPRQVGAPLTGHTGPVLTMAFGPEGLLATGGGDGTVRLWDTSAPATPRQLGDPLTGHTDWVRAVAFGPDGLLATGADDGTVRLWDTSAPATPRQLGDPLTSHTGPVLTMAYGQDGLLATGGDDGTVRLWDDGALATSRELGDTRSGHRDSVLAVAFGPGGLLGSGSYDNTVRLWDISVPSAPRPLGDPLTGHAEAVNAVAFGPDRLLATGGDDGTVRLWDVSTPTDPRPLGDPLTSHTGWVNAVAFGPDGLLATGGDDGTVRLWDISVPSAPRPLGDPLTGHAEAVNAVAFGPDGLLASSGNDGTVRLWDTSILRYLRDNAILVACQRAGRGLDEQEWNRYLGDEPYRNTCPDQPTR